MRKAFEEAKAFEESVAEQARIVVDELSNDGSIQPESGKSSLDLFGWIRNRQYQPDFLLRGPKNTIMVEAKSRPPMIYDVFQLKQVRHGRNAIGIICVPDSQYLRTTASVKEFAEEENVLLCPISEMGDTLEELLR